MKRRFGGLQVRVFHQYHQTACRLPACIMAPFGFDPSSRIERQGGGGEGNILLKLRGAFHAKLEAREPDVLHETAMPESQEGFLAARENENRSRLPGRPETEQEEMVGIEARLLERISEGQFR